MLDVLRGSIMLLVVFGHALQVTCGLGNPVHDFIRSFQMELFFMISGFSLAYAERVKMPRTLAASHLLRLGVPYLTWCILMHVLRSVALGAEGGLVGLGRLLVVSPFWFLRELLFVMLSFDAYLLLRQKGNPLAISVAVLTCLGFSQLPGQGLLLTYAVFFLAGYLLNGMDSGPGRTVPENWCCRFLKWCGVNSLGIYAIHWNVLFVAVSGHVCNPKRFVALGLNEYCVSAAVFLLWIALTCLLISIIKKVPVLSFLLIGHASMANGDRSRGACSGGSVKKRA